MKKLIIAATLALATVTNVVAGSAVFQTKCSVLILDQGDSIKDSYIRLMSNESCIDTSKLKTWKLDGRFWDAEDNYKSLEELNGAANPPSCRLERADLNAYSSKISSELVKRDSYITLHFTRNCVIF